MKDAKRYARDMMDDAAQAPWCREADLDIDPETERMRREGDSEDHMAAIEAREAAHAARDGDGCYCGLCCPGDVS